MIAPAMHAGRSDQPRQTERLRRRVPHVTASALSAIFDEVLREGVPELHGRKYLQEAAEAEVQCQTPYGNVMQVLRLPCSDGSETDLVIAHPTALLWEALSTCSSFSSFFKSRLEAHPCTFENPWNLVLYTDEVTPGAVLAPLVSRKCDILDAFRIWRFSSMQRVCLVLPRNQAE